ncbi:MAG: glycosyl hydrolase [Planctomycetota bacterium]
MKIDSRLQLSDLRPAAERVLSLAARKAKSLDKSWDTGRGTPVFTVEGTYTTRGWTEWTQGFQYGLMILAGDALDDSKLIQLGKKRTLDHMLAHVTHIGVHDHGFNNLSTYGNLLRLWDEGRLGDDNHERLLYENAIAASGAVQAARWQGTPTVESRHTANAPALGYIYSFNGPHSLFIDTMRTTRILGTAWQFGHALMHEGDRRADLLKRSVLHGLTTSHYIVFHGPPVDNHEASTVPHVQGPYNVRGRTAHEGLFNRNDGAFRARSTQQGYSPFSTWTRGLSWAMCGYAEELEFFKTISAIDFKKSVGISKVDVMTVYERCAIDTCDHYINDVTSLDGITYWDDGAPGLSHMEGWRERDADPYNAQEPVDSTASAIAAQGLIRLGNYLGGKRGKKYVQAGYTVARTLFDTPYLSTKSKHQGLLLHSIYHWPNGWDHVPAGSVIPHSESSLWGDYHVAELALLIARMADDAAYPTFFFDR